MPVIVRFSIFYALYFTIIAFYLPFFPAWLSDLGYTANEVAILIAAAVWGRLLMSPLLSWFADSYNKRRDYLFWAATVLFLLIGLMVFFNFYFSRFWLLFIFWAVAGGVMSALIPLIDSLANIASSRAKMDYGKARLWGSLAFILFSMTGYFFLKDQSSDYVLNYMLFGVALMMASILLLPDYRHQISTIAEDQTNPRNTKLTWPVLPIIQNKTLFIGILIASLLQGSHAALYGLASYHWAAIGLNKLEIGQLWAIGVLVEVMVFFFGGTLLKRLSLNSLFLIAIIGGIIRWSLIGLTNEFILLSLLQILHASTFAITHLTAINFIERYAPSNLISSAQGMYDSLGMGLFIGLAMIMAGSLYQHVAPAIAFQSMLIFCFFAMIGLVYIKFSRHIHKP